LNYWFLTLSIYSDAFKQTDLALYHYRCIDEDGTSGGTLPCSSDVRNRTPETIGGTLVSSFPIIDPFRPPDEDLTSAQFFESMISEPLKYSRFLIL
jgi:hypothetical protein